MFKMYKGHLFNCSIHNIYKIKPVFSWNGTRHTNVITKEEYYTELNGLEINIFFNELPEIS